MIEPYRLSYADTDRFAPLVLDHLSQDPFVASLGQFQPTLEGLRKAAAERRFEPEDRKRLVASLERQYHEIPISALTRQNLDALAELDTLTVTTGHQLCLFTGPLYVPLKILNTIRLANDVSDQLQRKVVPIFWMATEDHDRAEIDHAWVNGKKIVWKGEPGGAVGRMKLKGIEAVLEEAGRALGVGTNADLLRDLLHRCYRSEFTLAHATRLFVNELFGDRGIICLDADDAGLKSMFVPLMRSEILEGITSRSIAPATKAIAERYKVQANSREINLFHLSEGNRSRLLEFKDGRIGIDGSGLKIGREELVSELEEHPEQFSPNVLLRPLYQETILPNIAYIGGGGELAYWLQLRTLFETAQIPMPVLLLRSSAAMLPKKECDRATDLGLSIQDLFKPEQELQRKIAIERAGFSTGMTDERSELKAIYDRLAERAASIDPTLARSAGSAAHLAFKGIDHLENRFIRAAKRKAATDLERLKHVLDAFFPGGGLQERRDNFMTFFLQHGDQLFEKFLEKLDPLDPHFTVFVDDPADRAINE